MNQDNLRKARLERSERRQNEGEPPGDVASEEEQHLRQRALRLLAVRDRTKTELRRRLGESASPRTVARVIAWLEGLGYIDDGRFAEQWVRSRRSRSGPRKLAFELEQKGVPKQLIRDHLSRWADDDQAYEAALALVRRRLARTEDRTKNEARLEAPPNPLEERLAGPSQASSLQAGLVTPHGSHDRVAGRDRQRVRQRLMSWLARRGFTYEVARRAVEEALAEHASRGTS